MISEAAASDYARFIPEGPIDLITAVIYELLFYEVRASNTVLIWSYTHRRCYIVEELSFVMTRK